MIFDGSLFKTRIPLLKMSHEEQPAANNAEVYDPVRVIRPSTHPPPARNLRSEVRELREQVREHHAMLQAVLDSMGRAAVSLDWRSAHSSFVNSANNSYNAHGASLASDAFNAEFPLSAFRFPVQTTHHSNFNMNNTGQINQNNNTNQNNPNTRRNRRRDFSTTHTSSHERRQTQSGANP